MTYFCNIVFSQGVRVEWDKSKAEANAEKHGLCFEDAAGLFAEGNEFLEVFDSDHSNDEERFIAVGPISSGVVTLVYTERNDDVLRIISARWATAQEIELFHNHMDMQ